MTETNDRSRRWDERCPVQCRCSRCDQRREATRGQVRRAIDQQERVDERVREQSR